MTPHIWKGALPRCVRCNCTSLVAQHFQPDTQGAGPCPLVDSAYAGRTREIEDKLLAEWVARQQAAA